MPTSPTNCLVGCVSTYKTGQLKKPIQSDSPSPWVRIDFSGTPFVGATGSGPYQISVGNQSARHHHNTACIKSFKYGISCQGGAGCTVEIYDEEGTSFEKWMDKLNKSLANIQNDYKMKVQFGWTGNNCTGAFSLEPSPIMTFLPQNITSAYESGKIKYTIQGMDLMQRVFESRANRTYGTENARMPLKQAVRQLFLDNKPRVDTVRFLRVQNNGQSTEWGFRSQDGGADGPRAVWHADQQNALATVRTWIHGLKTDRDKGVFASWDAIAPNGGIIFWEDTFPGCSESINPDSRTIGTYIVNGGKCSSVISFSPSVQWNFMYAGRAGGGTGGAGSSGSTQMPGDCRSVGTGATGNQDVVPVSIYAWFTGGGPENATPRTAEAAVAHQRANMTFQPITAELRVQGDPSLCDPLRLVSRTVSVVVINPFHLTGNASSPTWLATDECNKIFSNKAWLVLGVDHDIREGSYCTTLKLMLATPGSNIERNAPLGGFGSGGYQFPS